MSAPALPVSLVDALRSLDFVAPENRNTEILAQFLNSLNDLRAVTTLATLSHVQSERLEAAYLAGAKCIDDAGLLLAVPRDALLSLMTPYSIDPERLPDQHVLIGPNYLRYGFGTFSPEMARLFARISMALVGENDAPSIDDWRDAELWRFLLRALLGNREGAILDRLAPQFAPNYNGCKDGTFAAHVAAALAEFKSSHPKQES